MTKKLRMERYDRELILGAAWILEEYGDAMADGLAEVLPAGEVCVIKDADAGEVDERGDGWEIVDIDNGTCVFKALRILDDILEDSILNEWADVVADEAYDIAFEWAERKFNGEIATRFVEENHAREAIKERILREIELDDRKGTNARDAAFYWIDDAEDDGLLRTAMIEEWADSLGLFDWTKEHEFEAADGTKIEGTTDFVRLMTEENDGTRILWIFVEDFYTRRLSYVYEATFEPGNDSFTRPDALEEWTDEALAGRFNY